MPPAGPVETFDLGVERVAARGADVMFAEREILLDAAMRSASAKDLMVLERNYNFEPIAFALARGDEDFRLFVDRSLSQLYRSQDVTGIYAPVFGKPDADALRFFRTTAVPD